MQIKSLLFFGILLASNHITMAQGNKVQMNPYRQDFLIGEHVRLSLNVTANDSQDIIWPIFSDTVTSHIEIIASYPIDTIFSDSISRQEIVGFQKNWAFTSFDSGLWSFPEITIWVDSIPLNTSSFLLAVSSVKVDTTAAFIDIIAPIEVPMTWMEYIQTYYYYGLIVIGIILLIALITYFLRRKKEITVEKVIIASHVHALDRLHKLQKEQLWESGMVKAYYIQLSDILREYIENRFEIPVKESTTVEIKHLLKPLDLDKALRKELINLLRTSDLVKFAKANPHTQENIDALDTAFKWISETQIDEIVESENDKINDNE